MNSCFKIMTLSLLLIGIVDQVNGDKATIEYLHKGRVLHTTVDLSLSPCTPVEGQRVSFFPDYKVVTCGEKL